MKSYKHYLLAGVGCVILLGSFVLSVPRPAQGQGGDSVGPARPVNVVNTPAEPVPVAGAVSVTNTPDVTVANTVRINDAPRQPYDARVQMPFGVGEDAVSRDFSAVPPGKQLVVTHVSASIRVLDKVSIRLLKIAPLGSTENFFELVPVDTGAAGGFVASEPLHTYVNSGYSMSVTVSRNGTTGGGSASVSITGYLVDAP